MSSPARTMRAVVVKSPGPPENLSIGEIARPSALEGHLLVRVAYTALNRADTLQRKGAYPPPPGAPETLGMELGGIVAEVGPNCGGDWKVGDRLAGLVAGGSYAEYCLVEAPLAMRVPPQMSLKLAASLPEAWLTAYQLLFAVGLVQQGERVLVHAGASGVGLAAIQLAREAGAVPYATVSAGKAHVALGVGAERAIDYKKGPFLDELMEATGGSGVDVVLDCVGANYYAMNIEALAKNGRYVLYGFMGGVKAELDMRPILRKCLSVTGTTLRGRPLPYKEALVRGLWTPERVAKFVSGELQSVIHQTFDLTRVAEAHGMMEANQNAGKIMLEVDPSIE